MPIKKREDVAINSLIMGNTIFIEIADSITDKDRLERLMLIAVRYNRIKEINYLIERAIRIWPLMIRESLKVDNSYLADHFTYCWIREVHKSDITIEKSTRGKEIIAIRASFSGNMKIVDKMIKEGARNYLQMAEAAAKAAYRNLVIFILEQELLYTS